MNIGVGTCAKLALCGGVLALLAGCLSQRAMLYKPGFYSLEDSRKLAEERGLRPWPGDGPDYAGLVSRTTAKQAKGTVVVFHGNAGVAPFRSYYVPALESRGYRVVLAEYPGYGGRPGELTEPSLVADGVKTARQAAKEFGAPLYLWGESLGAAVAAAVARDPDLKAAGVVMLTPWDTLANLARAKFPATLVKMLMRDTYDSVANLSGFAGPVAVIVAEQDEVIPPEFGRRLHDALSGRKRLWVLQGSHHNDWPRGPELGLWTEVMDFLGSTASGKGRNN